MLAFASADIIFHNFLEFHSILLEKRFLSQIFFLTASLKPPAPLTTKIR